MQIDYQNLEDALHNRYAYMSGHKVERCYVVDPQTSQKNLVPVRRLGSVDIAEYVGAKVVKHSFNKGGAKSDGSGTGFFGLLVSRGLELEWLVVTIDSSAVHHALLDHRWIESFYSRIKDFKPPLEPWWIQGRGFTIDKDDFTSFIQGCIIKSIDLQQNYCNITLTKDGQDHLLEILNTDPRLCPWPGALYRVGNEIRNAPPKAFPEGEHMGDYIVLIPEDGLIYV